VRSGVRLLVFHMGTWGFPLGGWGGGANRGIVHRRERKDAPGTPLPISLSWLECSHKEVGVPYSEPLSLSLAGCPVEGMECLPAVAWTFPVKLAVWMVTLEALKMREASALGVRSRKLLSTIVTAWSEMETAAPGKLESIVRFTPAKTPDFSLNIKIPGILILVCAPPPFPPHGPARSLSRVGFRPVLNISLRNDDFNSGSNPPFPCCRLQPFCRTFPCAKKRTGQSPLRHCDE